MFINKWLAILRPNIKPNINLTPYLTLILKLNECLDVRYMLGLC